MGGGAVDLTSTLAAASLGEWRTIKVELSCLRAAGARVAGVDTPFALRASNAVTLSISEVQLAANENDTVCPAAVGSPTGTP